MIADVVGEDAAEDILATVEEGATEGLEDTLEVEGDVG